MSVMVQGFSTSSSRSYYNFFGSFIASFYILSRSTRKSMGSLKYLSKRSTWFSYSLEKSYGAPIVSVGSSLCLMPNLRLLEN